MIWPKPGVYGVFLLSGENELQMLAPVKVLTTSCRSTCVALLSAFH